MTALQKGVAASDLRNVPMIRVEAVDGRKADYTSLLSKTARAELTDLKVTGKRKHHAQLSPGAIGCYLSHYEVWRTVAATSHTSRDTPFLVLEDDADIPQNAHVMFQHGWKAVQAAREAGTPPDAKKPYLVLWHLICLHGCDVPASNLYEPEAFWSTMAYSLTPDTAAALLKAPLFPMDVQIDTALYLMKDTLRVFAFPCLRSGNTQTDIQVSIVPNAPLLRPAHDVPAVHVADANVKPADANVKPADANVKPADVVVAVVPPTTEVDAPVKSKLLHAVVKTTHPSSKPYIITIAVLAVLFIATTTACIALGLALQRK